MSQQHTPGPWRVTHAYGYQIVNREGAFVADTDRCNARLIEAAPELLAALQPLAAMGDAGVRKAILAALRPHERDSFIAATANARAAIAKATGGQP